MGRAARSDGAAHAHDDAIDRTTVVGVDSLADDQAAQRVGLARGHADLERHENRECDEVLADNQLRLRSMEMLRHPTATDRSSSAEARRTVTGRP
jgi:hypothetical protein